MSDDEIYEYCGLHFEWNRVKAAKNAVDHGVRFTEAATVFLDKDALVEVDEAHSHEEERFIIVGRSIRPRTLFVVHVVRGERYRLISARELTTRERRDYEYELGRRLRIAGRD